MKLRSENLWKLRTAIINRPMRLQLSICHKQELIYFLAFSYKTRANAQQMLSVQDINDKNLNGS